MMLSIRTNMASALAQQLLTSASDRFVFPFPKNIHRASMARQRVRCRLGLRPEPSATSNVGRADRMPARHDTGNFVFACENIPRFADGVKVDTWATGHPPLKRFGLGLGLGETTRRPTIY